MEPILECCCGMDVHKDKIEACILRSGMEAPIRETFGCIPSELKRLCTWLGSYDCRHFAMESTGVYWMPVYEQIESSCLHDQLYVVNAHEIRNLPGRKTDVKDAEWIAQLLQCGLLHNSFIPERDIRFMREVSRTRRKTVGERSSLMNHLEKYLQMHGFKFSSVFSSITVASCQKLIRRLADKGSLDGSDIHECWNGRLRSVPSEIYAAVNGELSEKERLMLSYHLNRIDELSRHIDELTRMLSCSFEEYAVAVEIAKSIPGINSDSAMEILAEISPAPQKAFSSSQKLCKWAGVTPRNDESAGVIRSRRTLHGNPYVKSILVQCAWAAVKTRGSVFKSWFWAKQAQIGRKKAIVAIAHKILSLLYTLLSRHEFYSAPVLTR